MNEWWNTTINETKKILKIATALDDNEHTFFISGSNAVIFFLNELLTTDNNLLNQEQKNNLTNIIQKIKKPNDLDIKYKDIDWHIIESHDKPKFMREYKSQLIEKLINNNL